MAFQRIVHVVNRSFDMLEVMDDGIPWPIRPGYKRVERVDEDGKPVLDDEGRQIVDAIGAGPGGTVFMEPLPYFAAERAKRQNPVMGTEDPLNPAAFETLIAVPDWGDDYSPLVQSESIERLDRSLMDPDAQTAVVIPGRGARKQVKKRGADGRFITSVPGARAMVRGEQFENPNGIRLATQD